MYNQYFTDNHMEALDRQREETDHYHYLFHQYNSLMKKFAILKSIKNKKERLEKLDLLLKEYVDCNKRRTVIR